MQTQSSADSLSPAHQIKKNNKPHLLPTECKHKSCPTGRLLKPLYQTYQDRNQKEERFQPWRLGKWDLKHNNLKKK